MTDPSVMRFTDYDVPMSALTWNLPQSLPSADWTRVKFNVPGDEDSHTKVAQWLIANCTGRWRQSHYPDPKSRNGEYCMVVKFDNRDDALMFKLRGGHQAWQQDSQ